MQLLYVSESLGVRSSLGVCEREVLVSMAPRSGEGVEVEVMAGHVAGSLGSGLRCQARADGPACVLGMGTANPPTEVLQEGYPDFFFNITNCGHKDALKAKFKRICKLIPPTLWSNILLPSIIILAEIHVEVDDRLSIIWVSHQCHPGYQTGNDDCKQ